MNNSVPTAPMSAQPAGTKPPRMRKAAAILRAMAWFLATAAVLALAFIILAAFIPELGGGRVVFGDGLDIPLSEVTHRGVLATLSVWLVLTVALVIAGAALVFALVVSLVAVVGSVVLVALALIVPALILLAPVALLAWAIYFFARPQVGTAG
jgi:hypothetical protein